jgi:hypothetical protein
LSDNQGGLASITPGSNERHGVSFLRGINFPGCNPAELAAKWVEAIDNWMKLIHAKSFRKF